MAGSKLSNIGLTSLDDLFGNDQSRAEAKLPKIREIPLDQIDNFPDHPFKVKLDEDMDQLVQSVKERGVITPITLRQKEDGRYELVSGHRRRMASRLAGLTTVPAEIKELTDDEAVILMVESNFQRSVILPSEKAFSYKMRMEAMKRQGQRTDLTSSPLGTKLRTDEKIALTAGDSRNQIHRYIRLADLLPALLDMVDAGKLAFRPAVELSYLKKEEQEALLEIITNEGFVPSLAQAVKIKSFSQQGQLNQDAIQSVLSDGKPTERKLTLRSTSLEKYFPRSYSPKQMEDTIIHLLDRWARERQQQEHIK